MEKTFIVRYRRALRELQEAYKLQLSLIDESDALRTLAYQQEQTAEKAILKNRKTGRGFLVSRLRECLDEEHHAWANTQYLRREIEEKQTAGYESEVSHEQNHELYLVIADAIGGLLDVLGSQYPKMLTDNSIATYQGNVRVSELILKFGSVHLKRIVKQQLQAATQSLGTPNNAPAAPASPRPGQVPADTVRKEKGVRFCNGFTAEKADSIAREIGLLDENDNFDATLTYKAARLCGFYKQLKTKKKVDGSLERLRDYFAKRYKMKPITSTPDPSAYTAQDIARETEAALKRLFPE